jgi:ribosomal protein L31E
MASQSKSLHTHCNNHLSISFNRIRSFYIFAPLFNFFLSLSISFYSFLISAVETGLLNNLMISQSLSNSVWTSSQNQPTDSRVIRRIFHRLVLLCTNKFQRYSVQYWKRGINKIYAKIIVNKSKECCPLHITFTINSLQFYIHHRLGIHM